MNRHRHASQPGSAVSSSRAPQRLDGRHPGGAQGGPQTGDFADENGGADAPTPGEDGDHNQLVLGGGADGGGEGPTPTPTMREREKDGFGQELDADVAFCGTQGAA
jgi:hypothetical protein